MTRGIARASYIGDRYFGANMVAGPQDFGGSCKELGVTSTNCQLPSYRERMSPGHK